MQDKGDVDAKKIKTASDRKMTNSYVIKDKKENTNASKSSFLSESKSSNTQLMPSLKQPKETLRKSLLKLKSCYWNECLLGLEEVVQISKTNSQLLLEFMPTVYKGITTLLHILRPPAEKAACQAAKQLFVNGPTVQGPEFEELIHVLLQKTADNKPHIRKNVLEALNSAAVRVTPVYFIKILLHKKTPVNNVAVRATVAKLLVCAFEVLDTNLNTVLNEDVKTRLVQTTVRLLQDNCYEIRYNGVKLVTALMQNKEYESTLLRKVSIPMLKRINKMVETMKIEKIKT